MNPKCAWLPVAIIVSLVSCASPGGSAPAPESAASLEPFEKLLGDLQQAAAGSQRPLGASDQVVVSLREAIKTPNYAIAEHALSTLRRLHAASPDAMAIVDRLVEFVRARETDDLKAADERISLIKEEFRAKVAARAPAKSFDSLLERLALVGQSRANEIYSDNAANRRLGMIQAIRGAIIRWQEFLIQRDAGQFDLAANTLESLASTIFDSQQVIPRSELTVIQRDVIARLQAVRETRIANLRVKVEDFRKKLPSLIDGARTAADLDKLLVELPSMRPGVDAHFGSYTSSHHELNNRIENLQRFVRLWQDYLNQLGANNATAAQQILGTISRDGIFETFYPRSRVLERMR